MTISIDTQDDEPQTGTAAADPADPEEDGRRVQGANCRIAMGYLD